MKVEKHISDFIDTNTYLLEEDNHLHIIDPADHDVVLEKCRNAASVTVLLTHEHFDHIRGLNRIRDLCASSSCHRRCNLYGTDTGRKGKSVCLCGCAGGVGKQADS